MRWGFSTAPVAVPRQIWSWWQPCLVLSHPWCCAADAGPRPPHGGPPLLTGPQCPYTDFTGLPMCSICVSTLVPIRNAGLQMVWRRREPRMFLCFFLDAAGLFEVSCGMWYMRHSRACLSNGFSSKCSTRDTLTIKFTGPMTGQQMVVIWIGVPHAGLCRIV